MLYYKRIVNRRKPERKLSNIGVLVNKKRIAVIAALFAVGAILGAAALDLLGSWFYLYMVEASTGPATKTWGVIFAFMSFGFMANGAFMCRDSKVFPANKQYPTNRRSTA